MQIWAGWAQSRCRRGQRRTCRKASSLRCRRRPSRGSRGAPVRMQQLRAERSPHLHRDWAHPAHICTPLTCTGTRLALACICTGTGLTPSISASGLGSPSPHLHRDWAHPAHICIGTGLTQPTSAPGLGSPYPHLHRDSPRPHLHRDWGRPAHICCSGCNTAKRDTRLDHRRDPGASDEHPDLQCHVDAFPTIDPAQAPPGLYNVRAQTHTCRRLKGYCSLTLNAMCLNASLSPIAMLRE